MHAVLNFTRLQDLIDQNALAGKREPPPGISKASLNCVLPCGETFFMTT